MTKPKMTWEPERAISSEEKRLRNTLAVNVRRIRKALRLTPEKALENLLGGKLDRGYWYKIERREANATLEKVAEIAMALGVDPLDLFETPDDEPDHLRSKIRRSR